MVNQWGSQVGKESKRKKKNTTVIQIVYNTLVSMFEVKAKLKSLLLVRFNQIKIASLLRIEIKLSYFIVYLDKLNYNNFMMEKNIIQL